MSARCEEPDRTHETILINSTAVVCYSYTMRNRRQEEETSETVPLFLDEQVQEEFANSLDKDANSQLIQFERAFGLIGVTVAVSVMTIPMVIGGTYWMWIHSVYSALLHCASVVHIRRSKTDLVLIAPVLLPIAILLLFVDQSMKNSAGHHHWGMALTNVVMGGGSIFLRRDRISTLLAIDEMHAAKYRYKHL